MNTISVQPFQINDLFQRASGIEALGEKTALSSCSELFLNEKMSSDEKNELENILTKNLSIFDVNFLDSIKKTTQLERWDILQNMQPMLPFFVNDTTACKTLWEGLQYIPQEERRDVVKNTALLFDTHPEGYEYSFDNALLDITETLMAILSLPQNDRETVVRAAKTLCMPLRPWTTNWKIDIANLLAAFVGIPYDEREELGNVFQPFFPNSQAHYLPAPHILVWWAITKPRLERNAVVTAALPLFEHHLSAAQSYQVEVLEAISQIPDQERSKVIKELVNLVQILPEIQNIAKLIDVVYTTLPLLSDDDISFDEKWELAKIAAHFSPQTRKEIASNISTLFNEIVTFDFSYKVRVFLLLSSLQKKKRELFMQEAALGFPKLFSMCHQDSFLIWYLLPPHLKTYLRLRELTGIYNNEEYREALITAIQRELLSDDPHPNILILISTYLEGSHILLHITQEHELLVTSKNILALLSRIGPTNPIQIYTKFFAEEELFPVVSPTSTIREESTSFRLDQFQMACQAFTIFPEELPQEATKEAWIELINRVQAKAFKEPLAKLRLEELGTTWNLLWNQCLSDPYLHRLLENGKEEVSIISAQFRAILRSILTKGKEVKPEEVFSEQEELLLKMAMSIQACPGGKNEGIALTYWLLDPVYRYPAKGFETGNDKKDAAFAFIASEVQKILLTQFSGTNAFMKELTGENEVRHASHHAIYVKNLIGPVVGLSHTTYFDLHTHVLHPALVRKSQREVLETFFRHMTPEVFVREFTLAINNKENAKQAKKALSCLAVDLQEGFELAEDDITVEFNDYGSLQILRKAGYLT